MICLELSVPGMTVGAIRAFLADMPDDAEVIGNLVTISKITLQRCFVPDAPVRPAVQFETIDAIRSAFADCARDYGSEG